MRVAAAAAGRKAQRPAQRSRGLWQSPWGCSPSPSDAVLDPGLTAGGQPGSHPALGPPGCPQCERDLAGPGQRGGAHCWWSGASGVVLKLHLRGGRVPSPAAVSPLSLAALGNPGELGVHSTLVPGCTQCPPHNA